MYDQETKISYKMLADRIQQYIKTHTLTKTCTKLDYPRMRRDFSVRSSMNVIDKTSISNEF